MPAWILMAASSWVKAYKSTQHSQGEGPKITDSILASQQQLQGAGAATSVFC